VIQEVNRGSRGTFEGVNTITELLDLALGFPQIGAFRFGRLAVIEGVETMPRTVSHPDIHGRLPPT
jgi:hypothetical protein